MVQNQHIVVVVGKYNLISYLSLHEIQRGTIFVVEVQRYWEIFFSVYGGFSLKPGRNFRGAKPVHCGSCRKIQVETQKMVKGISS